MTIKVQILFKLKPIKRFVLNKLLYCKSQYFCRLRLFRDIKTRKFFVIRIRFYCTLQWLFPAERNRQTSGESASLPQYLGCNTVFDMRLRVTFLRRKTVLLQSSIAHRE